MADIVFNAKADYEEVVRMRKEIEKLNEEVNKAQSAGDKKLYESLNKQLGELQKKYDKATQSAAENTRTITVGDEKVEKTTRRVNAARLQSIAGQRSEQRATVALTGAKGGLLAITRKLITLLMRNVYALAASAIIGLGTAVYKLYIQQTAAESAAKKLNERLKEQRELVDEERSAVESSLRVIQDDTLTRGERQRILDDLQKKYPSILKNLDIEAIKYGKIEDILKRINEELAKKTADQLIEQIGKIDEILGKLEGKNWRNYSVFNMKEIMQNAGMNIWEYGIASRGRVTDQLKEMKKGLQAEQNSQMMAEYNSVTAAQKITRLRSEELELEKQIARVKSEIQPSGVLKDELKFTKEASFADKDRLKTLEARLEAVREDLKLQEKLNVVQKKKTEEDKKAVKAAKTVAPRDVGYVANVSTLANVPARDFKAMNQKLTSQVTANWQKERNAWNEYLREYGTFMQKVEAINELYREKINATDTLGDRMRLEKEREDIIRSLSFEDFSKSDLFGKMFEDVGKLSTDTLKKIAENAKAVDVSAWNPADIEAYQQALQRLTQELEGRNPFDTLHVSWKELIKAMKGNDKDAVKASLDVFVTSVGDVMGYVNAVGDATSQIFSALGNDAAAEQTNNILGMVEGVAEAGVGIAKLANGDISGIKDLAKGIANVVTNWVRFKDAAKEREIERIEKQVEKLRDAYDDMADKIGEAYGKDASNLIKQNNQLLRQQQIAIKQQIAQEEAKKKTDKKRVEEWKREYDEINKLIADNEKAAQDAIFGEDIQSAIERFAQAYSEMWGGEGDSKEIARRFVKDTIRAMILETMKTDISEPMKILRAKMEQYWADSVITAAEEDDLNRLSEELFNSIGKKYEWADKILKDATKDVTQDAASRGGYETISQQVGSELLGINTDLQMRAHDLVFIQTSSLELQRLQYDSAFEHHILMAGVAKNISLITSYTQVLPEMNETLKLVKKGTDKL